HRIWGLSWYWNRGQEEVRLRRAIERAIENDANVTPTPAPMPAAQPEEVQVELDETPDWVVPYRIVVPRPPRTGLEMHEGDAQADLQRMIWEVVRGEGPVATEVVLLRVRARWGVNRAGSRARGAFETAVRTLRRRKEIESPCDGFLALPGQSESV